ncbi:PQQ-dependent sugar dehydrogenase [Burkholderiaceae bacterium FT117]|uniref:PQQ-dependent sugar dehydrogenase n=1 Tax=Zeimonas sediminis TaxID=2944268 RepID=UPI00234301B0|nr:PQQ-dependent sugar dehydrogenase [Zeimonas sediminis]MCM5571388.1 PQQ-dependent sugar dehydrogenase [Zeimonas sediminis]
MSLSARRRFIQSAPALLTAAAIPSVARSQVASAAPIRPAKIAAGLEHPWSLAFLPDATMLVTERPGRLRRVFPDGRLSDPLKGVPEVAARGQGGLLDVVLGPGFAADRSVFLSFSQPTKDGARTAVARGTLSADGASLRDVSVIFAQKHATSGGNHFGSRLAFARDGNLFVTTGDRWSESERAQTLDNHFGKILRIRPDGSVPPDNPFVNRAGALPEIHSYGHRNVQGAALHPDTGALWTHEHGPQGGDEVNVEKAGANYGWPVITFGRQYVTGFRIGEGTERADVEPPLVQWTPSIAPSGMAFLTSDRYPGWRGNLFVGSLKFRMLARLELDGARVAREERLLTDFSQRIRDVRQGPDGLLYLLTDADDGQLVRLDPLG